MLECVYTDTRIASLTATLQVRPVTRIAAIIVSMVTATSLISGFNLRIMKYFTRTKQRKN